MNVPNKITIARISLIPIFLLVLLIDFGWGDIVVSDVVLPVNQFVAAIIFVIAASTDWVDGYYARKYNQVTNLGKFLDPLADKLLVSAALIVLVELGYVPSWVAIIIIAREFAVTGMRLLAAGGGEVVAASMPGKIKMWLQIVAITAYLVGDIPFSLINVPFADIAMALAVISTIYSGYVYFKANSHFFIDSK